MIMYFYYKNIVFALPQFFYLFFNAYSGQTVFEDFYISFYNLLFTSWPVIIRAVFDQDIYYKKWSRKNAPKDRNKVLAYRENLKQKFNYLYYVGQTNQLFNFKNILLWFINSVIAAAVIFWICIYSFSTNIINSNGQVHDIWFFSILIYTIVIFVVDLKLLMLTKHFNMFIFISVILCSIVLYIVYFFIADMIPIFLIYKTAKAIMTSLPFFLTLLLILGFVTIVDLFIISIDREINKPMYMLFKSLVALKKNKNTEQMDFNKITQNALRNETSL